MQESVRLEGWNLALGLNVADSDTQRPCPFHRFDFALCVKGATTR